MKKEYSILNYELKNIIDIEDFNETETINEIVKTIIKDFARKNMVQSKIEKIIINYSSSLKIDMNEYDLIMKHLIYIKVNKTKISLLYLASRDGFEVLNAINRVQMKDNILIIVTTVDGRRLSIYTEQGFGNSNGTWIQNKKNMLFLNLSNPNEVAYGDNRLNDGDSNVYYGGKSNFCVWFKLENQTKYYEIYIYNNSNKREDNYYRFTSSTCNLFKPSEIEIYQLLD